MFDRTNLNVSSNFTIRRFVGEKFPKIIQKLINVNGSADDYLENFLQFDTVPEDRKNIGLQAIFNSVFPVSDQNEEVTVEFLNYSFDPIQYTAEECQEFDLTYCVVLHASFRLIVSQKDKDTNTKKVLDIKEEKNVFFCEIPIPDESGSFIINGTKKVIVSQIHRSPGVFFYHDNGKANVIGKFLYGAKIVPSRGSWLDLEFDLSDILYFRIDKKRKLPVTTLLRSIGMSEQDIYDFFYTNTSVSLNSSGIWHKKFNPDEMQKHKLKYDFIDADSSNVLLKEGETLSVAAMNKFYSDGLQRISVELDSLLGMIVAADVVDASGNVLLNVGQEITKIFLNDLRKSDIAEIKILNIGNNSSGNSIRNTLFKDKNKDQDSALIDICKVLRPGEKPMKEIGLVLIEGLFFSKKRYDLSTIGRIKLNHSLGLNIDESNTTLTKEDIKAFVLRCVMTKDGKIPVDDIDHLGNRRIRTPAELVGNQIISGLKKAQRNMVFISANIDPIKAKPSEILQLKPLLSSLREFFNISQMVQFMDHTNPLSEITHKKRISALGPGGVDRVRAGLEIRDVHQTHYGRICSIETPEGSNIGLINALTTCAKINQFGFLEAPYFKVENGKISSEVVFLSSDQESQYYIGQSGLKTNNDGLILDEIVYCRYQDGFAYVTREEVAFVDISPVQVVSVASALIPFIENNDAKRSLMGANMQRQAVPLLKNQAPFVGTGVENIIGKRKGVSIVADVDGIVEYADGNKIILRSNDDSLSKDFLRIHNLNKFLRSNYNTCINQKIRVNVGDVVKKGDVIADGHSVSRGELALGANVLVAILPYKGYSFQDSIVISERVIQEDLFTSIHIEELEVVVRDTRLGPEEITRDVPNVSEDMLSNLDETGIVYVGAKVKPRDILVGKVTPQAEKPLSPEEKMLKAIFGEKANNVVDSSLYVPFGVSGTVIDVKILSRRGIEKDSRTVLHERSIISNLQSTHNAKMKIIRNSCVNRMQSLVLGQKAKANTGNIASGDTLIEQNLSKLTFEDYLKLQVVDEVINNKLSDIKQYYQDTCESNEKKLRSKMEKATLGHLSQGSLKVIKVFIAYKGGLQSGDKLSGRHGNKGVVSKIMPQEDMPFLEDGRVVDIILNPLGIPARMNIGQVFETHLGWASKSLGNKISNYIKDLQDSKRNLKDLRQFIEKIYDGEELDKIKAMEDDEFLCFAHSLKDGVFFAATPFSGNKISNIKDMLILGGQDPSGQVRLKDGCTGEYIDKKVTVGIQYLLKLHHLVDDKVHARSVGPYSLVTQQPLGGKGQFGGQRFGEMEGWALQAYGAAYTLREMLTIKSDDVSGRARVYQEITKGSHNFEYGIPESFNVIVKEMQSLCLNVRLEKKM